MHKGINSTLDEGQTAVVTGGCFDASAYGFYSNEGSHGMGDNREVSPSLKIGSGLGIPSPPAVAKPPVVRRLTPVECCRLQGFPDDWNAEGIDASGKHIAMADSSRYKQLGNAVTVNVAEWIARRILTATSSGSVC